MQRLSIGASIFLALILAHASFAQTTRSEKLHTCLTGRFPSLCNHGLLTPDQLSAARRGVRAFHNPPLERMTADSLKFFAFEVAH